MKILLILSLILVGMINTVYALESDTDYFISSDSIYLIFEVDASNENIFVDGGITIDNILYEFDTNQIKTWRITNDGDYGRIFGKTMDGDNYYLIYDLNGNDGKLLVKVWKDGNVTRLVEYAKIDKLF